MCLPMLPSLPDWWDHELLHKSPSHVLRRIYTFTQWSKAAVPKVQSDHHSLFYLNKPNSTCLGTIDEKWIGLDCSQNNNNPFDLRSNNNVNICNDLIPLRECMSFFNLTKSTPSKNQWITNALGFIFFIWSILVLLDLIFL